MLKNYSYILVLLTMMSLASCGAIMDDAQCDVSGGVPKKVMFDREEPARRWLFYT